MIEIRNLTQREVDIHSLQVLAGAVLKFLKFPQDFNLSLVLIGDGRMRKLNWKYRKKNRVTNVLSFEYGKNSGEVFLCLPVIKKEAKKSGLDFNEWLKKLLIHGIVHLSGYDHEKGREEALKMEEMEKNIYQKLIR